MTAEIPHVTVILNKTPKQNGNGQAGKVAMIGAFKTTETNPVLFETLAEAVESFGDDTTFDGCACLPYIFRGATSVLAVNVSTQASSTWTKTIDATNLASSLAKIKGEDWDILFVAATLTDTFIPIIDEFLDDCYEIKYPAGYVGALGGGTTSANTTSAGLAGEHCYALNTQGFMLDGSTTASSVLISSAYLCGLIAEMSVGNTLTMKTIDGVSGVSPELSFETGGAGKAYVEAGIMTFKCADRNGGRYICVNSEQPNGLDLYINRVRDYVVKELSLHQFLGERNRQATLSEIEQEISRVADNCINTLDLLVDIEYEVTKKSAKCVDIHITKLLFDGIITEINVYVSVEVE